MFIHADNLGELPKPTWLVENEIQDGGLAVMFGQPGSYKSFIALDIALHVAQRDPVIYVAAEGAAGYEQRVASWTTLYRKGRGNLYFLPRAIQVMDVDECTKFIEAAREIQPRLIVLDTLARCATGLDENSARDVGLLVARIQEIQTYTGAAVLVLHHAGKDGSYRGSSALHGAADTFLQVKKLEKKVVVKPQKVKDGRDDTERALRPVIVDESVVLLPAGLVLETKASSDLDEYEIAILRHAALNIVGEDGFRVSDLINLDVAPKNTAYRKVDSLVEKKLLFQHEVGGSKGKMFSIMPAGRDIVRNHDRAVDDRVMVVDGQPVQMPDMGAMSSVEVAERRVTPSAPAFQKLRDWERRSHAPIIKRDDEETVTGPYIDANTEADAQEPDWIDDVTPLWRDIAMTGGDND